MVEDLASPWAAALWRRVPTPAAARGTRLSTYDKLLKKHRIRRFDAAALKGQLARQPLNVDPASARAAETNVRLLAKRLAVVVEQIAETDGRIDAFLAELGGADPAPAADGDAQPGQIEEQRDATILRTIPGVGRIVLARASARRCLAEADDARRRRDYHALRCLCGTAAVTKQSGGYRIVTRRLAVHNLLRDVVYHWANTALRNDPVSEAKYRALRDRGHGHHRALRTVADRLLYVACAMLRDGTVFDPHHARPGRPNNPRREISRTSRRKNAKKPLQTGEQSYGCRGICSMERRARNNARCWSSPGLRACIRAARRGSRGCGPAAHGPQANRCSGCASFAFSSLRRSPGCSPPACRRATATATP